MKNYFIFLMLTALCFVVSAKAENLETPLASPYFVDELHCDGINSSKADENWFLSPEEVQPAEKIQHEEMCERILRHYGITKFMWLSPEDLERTATIIRQSGDFAESELSIRKSELQNHVHIFLKVKPGVHFFNSINEEFKYFQPKDQNSSRLFDHLALETSNRKYNPASINSFGLNMMGTSASSALQPDPINLTTDDQQKLQKRNAYFVDLYWRNEGSISKNFDYHFSVHLVDDNIYSDEQSRVNYVYDADILFRRPVNIFRGTFYVGPAFISTSYTPYQVPTDKSTKEANLPGFKIGYNYGQEFGNSLNFGMSYYRGSGDPSIYDFAVDLQKHVDFLHSFLILGVKDRNVQEAVLAQDRFPLSGPYNSNEYVGLAKVFHQEDSNSQLGLMLGSQSLGYTNDNTSQYRSAAYAGLDYKFVSQSWNIKVGLDYYFQRLY